MNPIIKNILAVVVGAIVGGVVNMGIIIVSPHIIPPLVGVDITTEAGLKTAMHLFTPINFIMPFLAHAFGTLVGAFIAYLIAASHKMKLALVVGFLFLIGGATDVYLLPSPIWFTVLDLIVAYIPMALTAGKLAATVRGKLN